MPLPRSDEDGTAVDPARLDAQRGMRALPQAQSSGGSPEQIVQQIQTLQVLCLVLDQLPPAQRQVITLRDVQGLDAREACSALAISESNQRVLLHRALEGPQGPPERVAAG